MKSPVVLSIFVVAAGCAAPATVPPPGRAYAGYESMGLIESARVAPPANDIAESERRAWLDANRPKPQPVPVQRVIVEREPVRHVRSYDGCHDRRDDWYVPFSLSLGWWGGSRHHRGWGWGLGWNSGWRNAWCW